jgi:hypothetical protein
VRSSRDHLSHTGDLASCRRQNRAFGHNDNAWPSVLAAIHWSG